MPYSPYRLPLNAHPRSNPQRSLILTQAAGVSCTSVSLLKRHIILVLLAGTPQHLKCDLCHNPVGIFACGSRVGASFVGEKPPTSPFVNGN
ncbi:hypothetical protein [Microcoleus sp. FACHB-831]|uniref:hypothetical protein n=1 Tax=Microcoleus sp. FACHB-831 TaxID=2692827 RepID=UPI001685DBF9|nr:hypothetical protein [Microcoleus sp. FACHB-831]